MQLTNTTDYAIRIVCYLASENKVITTAELSRELNIPASYIPKITKQLKEKEIVKAAEGSNGGYMLEKRPEEISLILYKSYPNSIQLTFFYAYDIFVKYINKKEW